MGPVFTFDLSENSFESNDSLYIYENVLTLSV